MNKKALFLASFCVIGLCAWEAQASSPEATPIIYRLNNLPHGYDHIILQGELLLGIGPNAIEAGASDDAVYIQFNQSFGNVSITIYNENNLVVYSTVLNTAVQQTIIIPITAANSGIYTVLVENATGYVEGEFDYD